MIEYYIVIGIILFGGFICVVRNHLPKRQGPVKVAIPQVKPASVATVREARELDSEAKSLDDETKYNFRGTRWGMRYDIVKRTEEVAPISETSSELVYKSHVRHIDCKIIYSFLVGGTLAKGQYFFTEKYEDPNRYLSDFNFIVELNEKKYGPAFIRHRWSNPTFENKPDMLGLALQEGHVCLSASWLTKKTELLVLLGVEQGELRFYSTYTPTPEPVEEETVQEEIPVPEGEITAEGDDALSETDSALLQQRLSDLLTDLETVSRSEKK